MRIAGFSLTAQRVCKAHPILREHSSRKTPRVMTDYSPKDFATAAVMKLSAAFLFAAMAVQVRYLGDRFPVGQVIFFRAISAFVPILIFYAVLGELSRCWQTQHFSGHVQRGTLSIASSFCYFAALARLPIVDVTAISFVTPLIVVVLAAVFLKEVVHIYRWSAVIVGFLGVIVMLIPYMDPSTHAAMSHVRRGRACAGDLQCGVLGDRRHPGASPDAHGDDLVDRVLLLDVHRVRRPRDAAVRLDHAELDRARLPGRRRHLRRHRAHHLDQQPPLCAGLVPRLVRLLVDDLGFLLGYLFFGEVPAALVAVGAVIVAAAGLFVVWRERQLGLKRPDEEQEIAAPRG